ncbi:peptidoglycan DD-metalloendopeptidase family protein [Salibacterium aidingense]|uniref:peptidoglycan DD-metalloendopeptidase family protein n=1 Tax=Salibacterium aidingense TaxID=384933 RepID=UPI00042970EA|nr:peptidoglycan DD-metalloendopeptidase family protein [Salibacterium aidingense]
MDYVQRFVLVGIFSIFLILLFLFIGASSMYAAEEDYIWPVENGVLTDTFGSRNGHHDGIDIAADTGSEVKAARGGEVTRAEYSSSYGNVVMVKHENNSETVYAHLSDIMKSKGESIVKGEVIGKVGNTGRSRGAHLHFELHHGEWNAEKTFAADPLLFLTEEKETRYAADKNNRTNEVASLVKSQGDEEGERVTHTIEKGDTLWDIAQTYDTTVEDLQKTNDIPGSLIYPDQQIVIS